MPVPVNGGGSAGAHGAGLLLPASPAFKAGLVLFNRNAAARAFGALKLEAPAP